LALGKPCNLDPKKVMSGKDPSETNNMLVMFCESATKIKGNSAGIVKKVLAKYNGGGDIINGCLLFMYFYLRFV
jgi:hypothetical protein